MADLRDYTKKNPIFTGTDGMRIPSGNSAQRTALANVAGTIRYNTDIGGMELYSPLGWTPIAAPPVIDTVSPDTYSGQVGTIFTISGANFTNDAQVYFITSNGATLLASTVTFLGSSTLLATTPRNISIQEEPIDVRVNQQSGVVVKLDCIDAGGVPDWITPSGSIGSVFGKNTVNTYVVATDPEGSNVRYSLISGALPGGLTLATANGLISGLANSVLATTTYNFTLRALDTVNNNTNRSFSYTIQNRPPVINTSNSSIVATIVSGNALPTTTISAYDPDGGQITFTANSGNVVNTTIGSANGVIRGTPIVVQSNTDYDMGITVTDEGFATNQRTYTFRVLNRPPVINTASGLLTTITSGGTLNQTISAYDPDGGEVSFDITSGNLISTANIGTSNGVITASNTIIVQSNTTYTFNVSVSDPGSYTVSNTYSINVLNRPPVINTASAVLGTIYSGYSVIPATIQAYDPDGGAISYAITSGNLVNTSINSANGYISGSQIIIPSSAYLTFDVTATDPGSMTTSRTYYYNVIVLSPPTSVEYLVVGAGGGGGTRHAGGGGAGGVQSGTLSVSSATNYPVTIGAGGTQGGENSPHATNGGNTVFNAVTAYGGGGGGQYQDSFSVGMTAGQYGYTTGQLSTQGYFGASGGGGGSASPNNGPGGGSFASQGNSGGGGSGSGDWGGGGGGGAAGAGSGGSGGSGGNGGTATTSSITGVSTYYAGGGGGGSSSSAGLGGNSATPANKGGAGDGGNRSGTPGTANFGGGGGGARETGPGPSGGNGGSGTVIIAFSQSFAVPFVSAGLSYVLDTTSRSGFNVLKITGGTGTIRW